MKKTVLILSLSIFGMANAQNFSLGWVKGMGDQYSESGRSVAVDGSGNVYTVGPFSGTVDFDPGSGVYNLTTTGSNFCVMGPCEDVFVTKFDAAGNLIWAKSMGSDQADWGYSMALDAIGNIYICGIFSGLADFDPNGGVSNLTSSGNFDIFVAKLDPSGNLLWAKGIGGTGNDFGYALALDASNNVYTTGFFSGTADFDPSGAVFNLTSGATSDIFISKLDASGNFVWAKALTGTNSSANNSGQSIVLDAAANVYTTGFFEGSVDFDPNGGANSLTPAGGRDAFISKLDASGNFVWAKTMGGTGNEGAADIALDGSGNIYTTGSYTTTADFNPGAGVFNLTNSGNSSCFVSKLDASGNFVWAKAFGGTNATNDYVNGVTLATDALGNVYTAGQISGTADFDPNSGVSNLTPAWGSTFLSKLDASGNFVSATIVDDGPSSGSTVYCITLDALGSLYMSGDYTGTVDFDPGVATYNLTSGAGIGDIFVLKLCQIATPTITTSGPTTICQGNSVTLTSSAASSYSWSTGATGQSITVNTPGNYAVTVSNPGACYATSAAESITVLPVPMFSYTTSGMVASFSITGSNCSSFLWDFGNGNTSSINPSPIVTYATSATYNVCLQCSGNTCVSCLPVTVPGTSSGGIGIKEQYVNSDISIYPNPFTSSATLSIGHFNEFSNFALTINDVLGREISNTILKSEKTEIKRDDLMSGIYFYQVKDKSRIISAGKIIIE